MSTVEREEHIPRYMEEFSEPMSSASPPEAGATEYSEPQRRAIAALRGNGAQDVHRILPGQSGIRES
ncbi:hypothetical protein COU77_02585 [Candidatus Peregrinibacteria bacterium CG10_big_fil_rev_8_21_14_0_10_49_16]|nr:MAG: hypothetical protein COW95_04690 [Candidatus Peregrinibacteria bacterium CG22_combo_CG10-13_8_21_14_all_49_11]PIR51928.1 MAG: hypothetical protein COU77_02585 [Candidatus Peregrinibacteria bacterium CG10_big_fil_rev_8_21_14_0_10_49_16]